ncbi:MAG: trypsin-like peptidase domain-containing protein [Ardenticatenaceae bacterium]|nr:trypsin-like peptidase domain-containing protein [Ardenticatenaceae bacterium]
MNRISRHYPLYLFIATLFLTALACQAPERFTATQPDQEAIIQAAVATIEAEQSGPLPATFTSSSLAAADTSLESVLVSLYQQATPSVVHIFVRDFGITLGSGSGFVFDTEGHIVTNNHVVTDGSEFEVAFADGSRALATLVGTDVDSDLAVIKVDANDLPPNTQPIPLGDSDAVLAGQFVIAIGNPFGEVSSMSVGIISGLGRTLESQRTPEEGNGRYSLPKVLQTDAAINPGNSGGPLLNLSGEVIGVNSAILTLTGTNSGVGFSIPVAAVQRIIPTLIAEGSYTYPYIGINMAEPLSVEALDELGLPAQGVYVTRVVPGTPADEAGLLGNPGPGGDYITAINGEPVRDSSELISYLVFETEVGQTIELTVIRNNQKVTVPLILGARP